LTNKDYQDLLLFQWMLHPFKILWLQWFHLLRILHFKIKLLIYLMNKNHGYMI